MPEPIPEVCFPSSREDWTCLPAYKQNDCRLLWNQLKFHLLYDLFPKPQKQYASPSLLLAPLGLFLNKWAYMALWLFLSTSFMTQCKLITNHSQTQIFTLSHSWKVWYIYQHAYINKYEFESWLSPFLMQVFQPSGGPVNEDCNVYLSELSWGLSRIMPIKWFTWYLILSEVLSKCFAHHTSLSPYKAM